MNIYYEFETALAEVQVNELLGWCLENITQHGSAGSYYINPPNRRLNRADRYLIEIDVWDKDSFDECVYAMVRDEPDDLLTSKWLVILMDETYGQPLLDPASDDEEFRFEFSEVIQHILKPGSKAKSWGDGPSAYIFDKSASAMISLSELLEDKCPSQIQAKKLAEHAQLSFRFED